MTKRIAVALSGGVDSALSLFLLKKQGYRPFALFMKNWEGEDESCPQQSDALDVASICDALDVPFYTINYAKEYWDAVFSEFIAGLEKGITPNPDILCNKKIKFDLFFKKALSLGAEAIATGHYCKIVNSCQLAKGSDPLKDQSYFLHGIDPSCLDRVYFPVGDLHKKEVRKLAKEASLPNAAKKDSVGICFIGKRDFKSFMTSYLPRTDGKMYDLLTGVCLQEHPYAALFTVGERAKIGGCPTPYYVAKKEGRDLYLVPGASHPLLFHRHLTAINPNWLVELPSHLLKKEPLRCQAKIRYRQEDQPCSVFQDGDSLLVSFDQPQRAICPGQSIVFYDQEICLGGAMIHAAGNKS